MTATSRRILSVIAALCLTVVACSGNDTTAGPETTSSPDDTGAEPGGGDVISEMFPDGVVRIGIANLVPAGFAGEDGEATGVDPELARAIFSELGIDEVDGSVVDFGSLIPGLLADQYDMIAAGLFITEERASQVLFSDPHYCSELAFGVVEGNPKDLVDLDSFADSDAVLAVAGGSIEEGYVLASGVPQDQVEQFGDSASMVDALIAGRVDAFVLSALAVGTLMADLDGYEPSPGFIPVVDGEKQLVCPGFAFHPDNQELHDLFNEKLREFKDDGRILSIIGEFGVSQSAVDAAKDVTIEDLVG